MNTKLTLSIDKKTVGRAKKFARERNRSLSNLVENYLKLITKNSPCGEPEYSSRVKSLLGSVSLPEDFDYKKEIADSLIKKYLSDE